MKQINLTHRLIALVDDEDFEYLNQWKWYAAKDKNTYYALRRKGEKRIRMHREILGLTDKSILCDHEDHNGLNNQKNNLREATFSQNNFNRTSRKNSASKYKGVYFEINKCINKTYMYWRAKIGINNKYYSIGHFKTEKEAAIAYNDAALRLHGEFANLNKI